jgi:hypothetical protein
VDGGVCRIAAERLMDSRGVAFTRSYHPICASGLLLAGLLFPRTAQGVERCRRPWEPTTLEFHTRVSHDTTVRISCHGEKEGYYSNHDDAHFIPRA